MPKEIKDKAYYLIKDYKEIIKIFNKSNIKYYDFEAELNNKYDDLLDLYVFRSYKHFSPKVYRILTNKIINFINSY